MRGSSVILVALLTVAVLAVTPGKMKYPCPSCGPPYPYWTGVELANASAPIRIEGYLAFTCPDCRHHWTTVVKPLLEKYRHNISFVHQPMALPYQYYSYDCTLAAYAVYRLLENNVTAWTTFADAMFAGQDIFFDAFKMSQEEVWTVTFAKWAAPLKVPKDALFEAMNGTITTANYDAWYQARYCRQRTFTGVPSFVVNGWLPFELQLDQWTFAQWDKWIDAELAALKTAKPQRR